MSEPPRKFRKLTFKPRSTTSGAPAGVIHDVLQACPALAIACRSPVLSRRTTSGAIHDVLQKCPALAIAFRSPRLREHEPGLAVKSWCLASKEIMGMVLESFHLTIDCRDGAEKPLPSGSLFSHSNFLKLRVTVIGDPEKDGLSPERMFKLLNFCFEVRHALRTITTIHLVREEDELDDDQKASSGRGLGKEIAVVFSLLAGFCPRVQRLRVEGDIGDAPLAAFRNSGSSLTSLETNSLPAATLGKLGVLLPLVTTTIVNIGFNKYDDWAQVYPGNEWFRKMLCSGIQLTRLDVDEAQLDVQAYTALQAAVRLEVIICRSEEAVLVHEGPPAGTVLPGLRRFESNEPRRACLHFVGNLLRAAPKLARFSPMTISTWCRGNSISDLVLVDQRVAAGLTFYTNLDSEMEEGGPNISLNDVAVSDLPVSEFASLLPVLTHIYSLELFYQDTMVDRSAVKLLAKAFPSLQTFSSSHQMDGSSLPALAAFPALSKLYLSDAFGYHSRHTVLELGGVCLGLPLLKELRCLLSAEDVEALQALLCEWDRAVTVIRSDDWFHY